MNMIFLGPPGAGKGTQAEKICRDYGVIQLSTGDLLRTNKKNGTKLGLEAQKYMDGGNLVPDQLIVDMIKEELQKPGLKDKNGYILDGFPRTVPQAEALDELLVQLGQKLDTVLVLNVPNKVLINRLTARRTCRVCGKTYHLLFNPPKKDGICNLDGGELYQRDDDKVDPIKIRLNVYETQTKPLIEYYRKKSLAEDISGVGEIDEIYEKIREILERCK